MICKKCQTYYVRDPCPNCGQNSSQADDKSTKDEEQSVKPSQVRERESGNQVLMQKEDEEHLVKPSQRIKEQQDDEDIPSFQRFANQEEEEHLVKPSQRIREQQDDDDIPSFKRFEQSQNVETRSTQIKKTEKKEEDDIPSFARYQQDEEVDVKNLSKLNKPEQQERLKNDKEYRSKVKETLEEVMGLLEKLIDDE